MYTIGLYNGLHTHDMVIYDYYRISSQKKKEKKKERKTKTKNKTFSLFFDTSSICQPLYNFLYTSSIIQI